MSMGGGNGREKKWEDGSHLPKITYYTTHDDKILPSPEPKNEASKQTFGAVEAQCQNHVLKIMK